ncbi:MAG: tRNA preQ1(34) S-adenosylmethionine ribosyltransferase-isomerase QueA [Chloroflexota bacterium]|nr:tRNA preQ1(34) S-adenosylmethionine ribosyltransferase-isomerase QueA [Chloroflexota bacterium]MDE2941120.1 tRNA preQ1(34) S-adenosylmethionine ribosyltransferase-isomerase QueA [Chloroflexota bacterium]MDE3267354.1 tRNA preQ1(34) S-adenosylmethionine ribosyltransferase-isomerase QueA [Chloroflexota bacterium]
MRTGDFDYHLPRELIAQTPMEPRDHSRLMTLDRRTGETEHRRFYEIGRYLQPGDLLVLNDSRVIPARLRGRRLGSGGAIELLLLHREGEGTWRALVRPGRRLRPGAQFEVDGVAGEVLADADGGARIIRLSDESVIGRAGEMPLPPYIATPLADPERYQTVYARAEGSAAAPTAGLHFTPQLLESLASDGVRFAHVTLHVGLDTFRPVQSEEPEKHKLHTEWFEVSEDAAREVSLARAEGRRVIAVGTTSVRVLEQAALLSQYDGVDTLSPVSGWADLFILPGHRFLLVDGLITNFHLPRSTLLMLVSAFASANGEPDAGRRLVLSAYREAIERGYRLFSFGDCMMIH